MSTNENDTPASNATSMLDLLKQDMQQLAASQEGVTIPVVGYEKTGLAIKYHLPESGKQLDDISTKVFRETKDSFYRNLNTAIDTMIFLCDGLYVKPADAEDYLVLDVETAPGIPVRFDDRFAVMLGLPEGSSARQIVRKLFDGNDIAITMHAEKLSRWMADTNTDLTMELWQLGN